MKPQRNWLRFRMRGLLAFVALCAVPSWFGSHLAAYRAEQRVLAELRTAGTAFQVESPISIFM
jgi:hypothetical protein